MAVRIGLGAQRLMFGEIKNLRFREFSIADFDEIMKVEKNSFPNRTAFSKEYFQKLYQEYPEGFIVAETLKESLRHPRGHVEKEIVGYGISKMKGNFGEIISVAIKPGWRKKGIGTKLVNFLINNLQKKGIKSVFLHVREKNKVAISFYKKLGFKIFKKIKNYYSNDDDALLMEKKLGG